MNRTVLVTGVSRRRGIGYAITRRLLNDGCSVFAQSWSPYDATEPWGADPGGADAVVTSLGGPHDRLDHRSVDFLDPHAPTQLIDQAVQRFPALNTLVVNHARSSSFSLAETTADELDATWAVNVRATVLLVKEFALLRPKDGRVVLFTSGQHKGPMASEIPYVATKGAVQQLTSTLSDAVVDLGITVNCVNPGPTDTGWASDEDVLTIGDRFPRGRWNTAENAADVVALLLSPDAATITGQTIDAEGGFRRG